eukprot:GHVL01006698.1.p1 GENE.GHVL01006698.1~~GHVL01006698.1.p1  ORF type:complete len:314 (+),score=19.34 GHVL01006698.1:18-959(+)
MADSYRTSSSASIGQRVSGYGPRLFRETLFAETSQRMFWTLIILQRVAAICIAIWLVFLKNKNCDRPVLLWCLVWLVRSCFSVYPRRRRVANRSDPVRSSNSSESIAAPSVDPTFESPTTRSAMNLFQASLFVFAIIWFGVGTYWIGEASKCNHYLMMVAGLLWWLNFVEFCLLPILFCTVICCMPCVLFFLIFMNYLFRRQRHIANQQRGTTVMSKLKSEPCGQLRIRLSVSGEEFDEMCAICTESYVDEDKVIHLSCGHVFHENCLQTWFRINQICPICREDIAASVGLPPLPTWSSNLVPPNQTTGAGIV